MKERPILFSAPMVRAILAGQKKQTRRIFKAKNGGVWPNKNDLPGMRQIFRNCPYGQPGDRLWVKETTLKVEDHGYVGPVYAESDEGRACLSGGLAPSEDDCTEVEPWEIKLRPSIFMPRSMARILLDVIRVGMERLNDISEADAIAEGVKSVGGGRYWIGAEGMIPRGSVEAAYRDLWESINGAGSWDKNPWVWVIEFKPVESPEAGG